MYEDFIKDVKERMEKTIASLKHSLNGLRTGRASTSLLDPIKVEAYGSPTPISQIGTVSAPEARLLTVQVWDAGLANAVTKAIMESGLGLNPSGEGSLIRIPLPELSEERRKELGKMASKYGEDTKVAVRNVRRDANDFFKLQEKDKNISEDECKKYLEQVQKITDDYTKVVDTEVEKKVKEIMTV